MVIQLLNSLDMAGEVSKELVKCSEFLAPIITANWFHCNAVKFTEMAV
jgi:hypothetical protein